MPDDPENPAEGRGHGEHADGDAAPSPAEEPAAGDGGRQAAADEPGQTLEQPSVGDDETVVQSGAGDETAVVPAPGEGEPTVVLPPSAGWSGRAGVPPARPAPPSATQEWERSPDLDGGRWWMPILIGVVGLLLLGILG